MIYILKYITNPIEQVQKKKKLSMAAPSLVQSHPPPSPQPQPRDRCSSHPVHKTLASAANLAHLLPTGTVLAFQALAPSFSNKGTCEITNKYLTSCLVGLCSIFSFLSSFTDSFIDPDGKLYYGIATFGGLYIFNYDNQGVVERESVEELARFRIRSIDFVHSFVSLLVFLIFALSDFEVQSCLFPEGGANQNALMINLPLGAGVLSSFLFMIFPTTRRGIGYADMAIFAK